MERKTLFVPEEAHTRLVLLKPSLPNGVVLDKLFYILDRIVRVSIENKELEQNNIDWTPLCSKKLQYVGIRNYKDHISLLLEERLILQDSSYQKGAKCRRYKLAPHLSTRMIKYEVQNKPLEKKIHQIEKKHFAAVPKTWQGLTIDSKSAREWLGTLEQNSHIQKHGELSICLIENKQFNVKSGKKSKRMYSVITNMRRDLRPFLRWNGKELSNSDLANSQFFFFCLFLDTNFYLNATSYNQKTNKTTRENLTLGCILNYNSYLKKSVKGLSTLILTVLKQIDQNEIDRFISICTTGTFYESINGSDFHSSQDRLQFKKQISRYFFGKTNGSTSLAKENFIGLFPGIDKLLQMLKKSNHKSLAWLLQTIESFFVTHLIPKKIKSEKPDLPIFTIHDSILSLKEEKLFTESIMEEVIFSWTGLKPTIK